MIKSLKKRWANFASETGLLLPLQFHDIVSPFSRTRTVFLRWQHSDICSVANKRRSANKISIHHPNLYMTVSQHRHLICYGVGGIVLSCLLVLRLHSLSLTPFLPSLHKIRKTRNAYMRITPTHPHNNKREHTCTSHQIPMFPLSSTS